MSRSTLEETGTTMSDAITSQLVSDIVLLLKLLQKPRSPPIDRHPPPIGVVVWILETDSVTFETDLCPLADGTSTLLLIACIVNLAQAFRHGIRYAICVGRRGSDCQILRTSCSMPAVQTFTYRVHMHCIGARCACAYTVHLKCVVVPMCILHNAIIDWMSTQTLLRLLLS